MRKQEIVQAAKDAGFVAVMTAGGIVDLDDWTPYADNPNWQGELSDDKILDNGNDCDWQVLGDWPLYKPLEDCAFCHGEGYCSEYDEIGYSLCECVLVQVPEL